MNIGRLISAVIALVFVISLVIPGAASMESGKSIEAETCVACSQTGGNATHSVDSFNGASGADTKMPCPCSSAESSSKDSIGMANPAAMYCKELGYEYKVVKTEDGEEGICVFPDGSQCDEWAFYRGEEKKEFSYCARNGWAVAPAGEGDAFATRCTTCVLPDGSERTVNKLLKLDDKCAGKADIRAEQQAPMKTQVEPAASFPENVSLPEHFDWRYYGGNWMTPVKNQGGCGSCWAFSAVGTVEPQYNIFAGNPDLDLDLSEQYLVSGCYPAGNCNGGWPHLALAFIRDSGITDEACFPYTASDGPCDGRCADWNERLKKIDARGSVGKWVEDIRRSLIGGGPLSAAMDIGSDYGGYWDGDIYRCTNDSDNVNHAVVIAGYDESENCWIVKNSWGSTWNGDGYFKVGCGECFIEEYVYYAFKGTVGEPDISIFPPAFNVSLALGSTWEGTLQIRNIGTDDLTYDIHDDGCTWLNENPKYGSLGRAVYSLVTVTINTTGLAYGSHTCNIIINNNDPDANPVTVPVNLTVRLDAPTNFMASANSESQIDLSWTKGTSAQKTMVRRSDVAYPTAPDVGTKVYFDTRTSISDNTSLLPRTTYYYSAWSWVSGSDIWSDTYATTSAATQAVPLPAIVGDYAIKSYIKFYDWKCNKWIVVEGGTLYLTEQDKHKVKGYWEPDVAVEGWPTLIPVDGYVGSFVRDAKGKIKNTPRLSLLAELGEYCAYPSPTYVTYILNAKIKMDRTTELVKSIKGTINGWGEFGALLSDNTSSLGQFEGKFTATPLLEPGGVPMPEGGIEYVEYAKSAMEMPEPGAPANGVVEIPDVEGTYPIKGHIKFYDWECNKWLDIRSGTLHITYQDAHKIEGRWEPGAELGWSDNISVKGYVGSIVRNDRGRIKNSPRLSVLAELGEYCQYPFPTYVTYILNAKVRMDRKTEVVKSIRANINGWGEFGTPLSDNTSSLGQFEGRFTATPVL